MADGDKPQQPTLPRGYDQRRAMVDLIDVVLATVPSKPADQPTADALGRLGAFAERVHRQSGGGPRRPFDPRGMGTPHADEDREDEP